MESPEHKNKNNLSTIEKQIKRRTFISFATFFAAGGAAYAGWRWLYTSPVEPKGITGGARVPLRRALTQTELFFRRVFSNKHLVKTYPKSMAATNVRLNSYIGIEDSNFNYKNWQLNVVKNQGEVLKITMKDILALPKTEIIFDFKCVEGWDQIQHWGGVKFTDFIEHFELQAEAEKSYIGLATPNGKYYVGMDMESALHPQTILAYEMNDKPINAKHGAPLRLIVPVKYGIKNLKRIGTITFSNDKPRDYWAERGYDYYSGL
jgi:DMSO/TMAO reductase YedYZ molybdopterin-dependent catalytic subunit